MDLVINGRQVHKTGRAEIKLNTKDIAQLWCDLDNHEQSEFFNHVAEIVKTWDGGSPEYLFNNQMCDLSNSQFLTDEGRKIMAAIGEFAEPTKS